MKYTRGIREGSVERFVLSSRFCRIIMSVAALFLTIQILIAFLTLNYAQEMIMTQTDANIGNILQLFERDLVEAKETADNMVKGVLSQDDYLRMLKNGKGNTFYHSLYHLKNDIELMDVGQNKAHSYVIADSNGRLLLEKRGADFSYAQLNALKMYLKGLGSEVTAESGRWYMDTVGDRNYLIRYNYSNGIMVMALIDIARLWNDYLPILKNIGQVTAIFKGQWYGFDDNGMLTALKTAGSDQGSLVFPISGIDAAVYVRRVISRRMIDEVLPMTVIVSALIGVLCIVLFILYFRREYSRPIMKLVRTMHKVREGDYAYRADLKCRNEELRLMGDSMNRMLDTIVQMRIERYEQVIQQQDTELKYYYMQIRPHFFLNALATLDGMSHQGENERMREYIRSLSKNIRYMFNAGFERVPLSKEAEHIDDYIRCRDILSPDSVFSFMDIPEETANWLIPQMMLHTFVENVYKHVVTGDRTVSLLIRAEIVAMEEYDGEPMLKIMVEDDGSGFPEPILTAVESGETDTPALQDCIGILNVMRTLKLMYGRDGLLKIRNNHSSGAKITVFIPKDMKRNGDERNEGIDR